MTQTCVCLRSLEHILALVARDYHSSYIIAFMESAMEASQESRANEHQSAASTAANDDAQRLRPKRFRLNPIVLHTIPEQMENHILAYVAKLNLKTVEYTYTSLPDRVLITSDTMGKHIPCSIVDPPAGEDFGYRSNGEPTRAQMAWLIEVDRADGQEDLARARLMTAGCTPSNFKPIPGDATHRFAPHAYWIYLRVERQLCRELVKRGYSTNYGRPHIDAGLVSGRSLTQTAQTSESLLADALIEGLSASGLEPLSSQSTSPGDDYEHLIELTDRRLAELSVMNYSDIPPRVIEMLVEKVKNIQRSPEGRRGYPNNTLWDRFLRERGDNVKDPRRQSNWILCTFILEFNDMLHMMHLRHVARQRLLQYQAAAPHPGRYPS